MPQTNDADEFDALSASDIPWLNLSLFSFFGIASLLIALLMGALQIIEMYTFGVVLMGTALILFVTTVLLYYTAPDPANYKRKARTIVREARGIFITLCKVMASLSGASMLGAIAAIWITGQGGKDLALAKLDAPADNATNAKESDKQPGGSGLRVDIGNPSDGDTKVLPRHLDPAIKDSDKEEDKNKADANADKKADEATKEESPADNDPDRSQQSSSSVGKLSRRKKGKLDSGTDWTPKLVPKDERVNPPALKFASYAVTACCISRDGYFLVDRHKLQQVRALSIVHNNKKYPAYMIEDFEDPDLALVATDYAPFKPFAIANRNLGGQEDVVLQSVSGSNDQMRIKNHDGIYWLYSKKGIDPLGGPGQQSGFIAAGNREFLGYLTQCPESRYYDEKFNPPQINVPNMGFGRMPGINAMVRHNSIGKVIEASRIREMMTELKVEIEDRDSGSSPVLARLDIELGSPRKAGEKVATGTQQVMICRERQATSTTLDDIRPRLPFSSMRGTQYPGMFDFSPDAKYFIIEDNTDHVVFRGNFRNNNDRAKLVCQLLDDTNELAKAYASHILYEHNGQDGAERRFTFISPAEYREQLNERLAKVLQSHLEAPNLCTLGAACFFCRYEPKQAFAILADEVRKAKTPENVSNFVLHMVAETGEPDGFEIVSKCLHTRKDEDNVIEDLLQRFFQHGPEAEQAIIDGIQIAKVDENLMRTIVRAMAKWGTEKSLAAMRRWGNHPKWKNRMKFEALALERRLKNGSK